MSEDYLAQKPVAIWNTVRGVWEKPETVSLLCEHLELFSESWMTSGSMRNGVVYELPMRERLTSDSEFSSSLGKVSVPTPTASDHSWDRDKVERKVTAGSMNRGVDLPLWAKRIEEGTYELLRTPAASEAERGHQPEEKARARGGQVTLSGQLNYLPTPNTMDDLPARDESKIDRSKGGYSNVRETVMRPNFDRFEPAVKRWEDVTGMEAPAPTKPDGKDGAHRLSSKFTEWMMGLPEGWVTGLGLSRKDELKACGNGVVPQQAELALRLLMEGKK
jgi:hypothetical protein